MQLDLGMLVAHLTLDSKSFVSGLSHATAGIDSFARKAQSFGLRMTAMVTAPLALVGRTSVKEFARFDQAITRSIAVLKGATMEMKGELEETALLLSTKVATSAVDLAEGYWELGQAGMDAARAMKALPVVERFAYVGTFQLTEAVGYLMKTQRAMGMEMQDPIENMKEMTRVSDNLTYAAIESTAKVIDFAEAMKNAGPMLRVMNKSIEEGTAALMALANQGHVGSEAGMQLYMVYRDIQRAFITNRGVWQRFGIDVYDSSRNVRLLHDIIADLEDKIGGLTDEGKRMTLMMLGFQDRSLRATQALMGTSASMKQYYKDLTNINDITKKAAEIYLKSWQAQMDIMINKIKDIRISIGEIVGNQLLKLSSVLDRLLQIWNDLTEPMRKWIVYFAEFVALLGPAAIALSLVLKSLSSILGVIIGLISPFGLLLGALGYLAMSSTTLAGTFETLKDTIESMFKTISEKFRNWTSEDTLLMQQYVETIGIELWGLKDKFDAFIAYLRKDFSGASSLIMQALVEGMKFGIGEIIALSIRTGQGIWEALKKGIEYRGETRYWEDLRENIGKDIAAEYDFAMREKGKAPYYVSTTGIGIGGRGIADRELYEKIKRDVEDRYMQQVYTEYPEAGRAAFQGANQQQIELMVNQTIRNRNLQEAAEKVQEAVTSGYFEGLEKRFNDFQSKLGELWGGEKATQPLMKEYAAEIENINERIAKEKEGVLVKYSELRILKEQERLHKERVEALNEAYGIQKGMTAEEKAREEAQKKYGEEAMKILSLLDEAEIRRKQAIVSLYEGMEHMAGAYAAHLDLLESQRAKLMEAGVSMDDPMLQKWYDRQIGLLSIEMGRAGETWRGGFGAYTKEVELNLKRAGTKAYEFAQSVESSIASGLENSMRDWDNWKDHILGIFEELYWSIMRIAFIQPLAQGIAGGISGMYPAVYSSTSTGSYTGSYVPGGSYAKPMAEGGFVRKPTFALIGEAGPEVVLPLDKYGIGAKSDAPTVNIINQTRNDIETANVDFDPERMIATVLLKDKRNRGPISRGMKGRG